MNKTNFYLAIVFAMMLPIQEAGAEVSWVDNSGTLLNREQTSVNNAQALPDSGVPSVLPGALTMQANSIFSVDNLAVSVAPQEMRFIPYDGSPLTSAPLFSNQFADAPSFSAIGINESYESGLLAQEVALEPVPEPATWVVAAMVACFILLRLRHKAEFASRIFLFTARSSHKKNAMTANRFPLGHPSNCGLQANPCSQMHSGHPGPAHVSR